MAKVSTGRAAVDLFDSAVITVDGGALGSLSGGATLPDGNPFQVAQHTSVGVSAIRRFLRPLAYQDAPEALLPAELRDSYTGIPRRVDGRLVLSDPVEEHA